MTEQTTAARIDVTDFRKGFLSLWNEIFVSGSTFVLDQGTAMFDTLAEISAEEANIPVSRQSASLAAQVQHTAYYIEELREGLATNFANKADWEGSWQIAPVDETQWRALIARLRSAYEWVDEMANGVDDWNADFIGGAFALVAHAAYHLGEIRQGIGVIRSR